MFSLKKTDDNEEPFKLNENDITFGSHSPQQASETKYVIHEVIYRGFGKFQKRSYEVEQEKGEESLGLSHLQIFRG